MIKREKREPREKRMRTKRKPVEILPNSIDYKDARFLRQFVTERGRIVPRRISGATAVQQRQLTLAIRRARQLAFLSYTSLHVTTV